MTRAPGSFLARASAARGATALRTVAALALVGLVAAPHVVLKGVFAVAAAGFFVALTIAAAQEIRVARALAAATVLEERRRLAREIHDGIAQDLAFIVQQADELACVRGAPAACHEIAAAARGALDESRAVIDALVRPLDEPLSTALARVAQETAGRWGAIAQADIDPDVCLPAATSEALLRIVREAVTNAARHGSARIVRVQLQVTPTLQLRIRDEGVGFDPLARANGNGHRGITGMRERAEALGGELKIVSRPGEGTQVVVSLP